MLPENFINEEISKVISRYKMEHSEAKEMFLNMLEKNPKLYKILSESPDLSFVRRLSEYKEFMKKYKKDVYYRLRTYRPGSLADTSQELHISTQERAPYNDEFFKQVRNNVPSVTSLLDIGGGLLPLSFPFEMFPELKHYVWVDKDKKAYESLKKLGNDKLVLFNESIGARSWEDYLPEGSNTFDLALMLKLVSVLGRQERVLLPLLTTVPADIYLVTSPKESMTKKESIERRERKVLRFFSSATGKTVIGALDVPNEFGYFLK
jgi:hypothetical protein